MKMILAFSVTFLLSLSPLFSQEHSSSLTDEQILELYADLRVADVSDGMDMASLPDVGLMDPRIEALWKDIDKFSHRFCGIAVTARYVPTNRQVPKNMTPEDFRKWEGNWYNEISPEPFVEYLKKGSVIVIDNAGDGDTGSTGSANILIWKEKGAVGLVSAGGVRDTDEIIKQGNPVYMDLSKRGRGIRPGRNEIESVQKPVVVGGVLVNPGDVIVADGDGVIVVPRSQAKFVAEMAHIIMKKDKAARKGLFEKLGIEKDFTVD
ncbi:RraA family protein [Flexithrix dorotheae]|uniref:RraA family protein n=1 Tax=Flexithrix dorotheae TaxID=70993 RepID=UPI0003694F0C|nr:RraA family protein [Flexithrix dorotheae]